MHGKIWSSLDIFPSELILEIRNLDAILISHEATCFGGISKLVANSAFRFPLLLSQVLMDM